MPPEDPITIPSNEPQPDSTAQQPNPEPVAAMTPEQIQEIVAATVAPMAEQLEGMKGFFQQVTQQVNAPEPAPELTSDDFTNEFYADPKAAAERLIESKFSELATPIVAATAQNQSDQLVADQQARIDSQFGQGAYEAVIKPVIDPMIAEARQVNPMQAMNAAAIASAVDGLGFKHLSRLNEFKAEADKKTTETQEAEMKRVTEHVINTSNLSGGLRRIQPDGKVELDDGHKEVLAERKIKLGEAPDEKHIAQQLAVGNSLESWLKVNKPANGAA